MDVAIFCCYLGSSPRYVYMLLRACCIVGRGRRTWRMLFGIPWSTLDRKALGGDSVLGSFSSTSGCALLRKGTTNSSQLLGFHFCLHRPASREEQSASLARCEDNTLPFASPIMFGWMCKEIGFRSYECHMM